MRRGRIIACVCLAAIFLAALVTASGYAQIDALGPGPGFFPLWLSLIGLALTILILIENWRDPSLGSASILPERRAAIQGGVVLAALVAAAVLLSRSASALPCCSSSPVCCSRWARALPPPSP